jgi:hypothetical protein
VTESDINALDLSSGAKNFLLRRLRDVDGTWSSQITSWRGQHGIRSAEAAIVKVLWSRIWTDRLRELWELVRPELQVRFPLFADVRGGPKNSYCSTARAKLPRPIPSLSCCSLSYPPSSIRRGALRASEAFSTLTI